jgi:hypothetical protein
LHFEKRAGIYNFAMIKKYNNTEFKRKGTRSATCNPLKGRLVSLFRSGRFFLEIKNLYKKLTPVFKVLRLISSFLPFFLNLQMTNV